ncbi:hypothetical protein PAXRUDRAFT_8803 [Paxillus rubicundulus Ve08.2h10]|uniref:Uncharacterized protein n=1 Tax=Paxillus rubicundulus Ve08.2h10 TaxID=930991 RepID=A0A0D0DLN6_9AGAM|nr:hypothetical protein PAXRUDRAFT_8803 [Paxillus rubicundulus Ve08.2h10]
MRGDLEGSTFACKAQYKICGHSVEGGTHHASTRLTQSSRVQTIDNYSTEYGWPEYYWVYPLASNQTPRLTASSYDSPGSTKLAKLGHIERNYPHVSAEDRDGLVLRLVRD